MESTIGNAVKIPVLFVFLDEWNLNNFHYIKTFKKIFINDYQDAIKCSVIMSQNT